MRMGGGPMGGMGMGMGMDGMDGMGGMGGRRGPRKAEPVRRQLNCTLEELYSGATKRIRVTRQRLNPDNQSTREEAKVLEIQVRRGWKKGTKITFENEGDEAPGVVPADIVFVIGEKPHPRFTREDNDLVHTARITLLQALTEFTLELNTLDGRTLSIPCNEVIRPNSHKVVRGEGMPLPKNPSQRGNLIVKFDIAFPSHISEDKRALLRRALA